MTEPIERCSSGSGERGGRPSPAAVWIAAALCGRGSAPFWAVALALGMLAGCAAPGRGGTSTGEPVASARPEAARGTDAADDIQVFAVNGERLRIPVKFLPGQGKVPLNAVLRDTINRSGFRVDMLWPDFAGEPQAEPRECERRTETVPPPVCEGVVLLALGPRPWGMSDHVIYGPLGRHPRLRRVGLAHGLKLYLFRGVLEGGPAPPPGRPESTFMHFEAAGRPEVRGMCVLDRSFRPSPGERAPPAAEITRGLVEALQARWPAAQCTLFDIPRGERVIGDVSFSAHRLPEWPLIRTRTRALMAAF